MAQPQKTVQKPAQKASAKEEDPAQAALRRKRFEELRETLLKDVAQARSAQPIQPDHLGHFVIRTNQPIPELNTTLSRAFVTEDEKDPSRYLYALVCDPHMAVRNKVIKALSGVSISYLSTMITSGITQVSGFSGRRLVLIYERPKGKSLAAVFAERNYKAFPEHFIIERIMAPLGAAIDHCADLGFSHGRINPDNIFIGETLTLGECAAEPCGYSQSYLFESPERAQANPAGKGEGTPAQDFYALGVLGAYLRLGPRLFEESSTLEKHIYRLLNEGSYQGFARNLDFSDAMTDLLRGTLNDSISERWTYQQLKLWTGGRRFNMLPPAVPPPGSRTFFIEKNEFKNLRDLAQGLYSNWDMTNRLLRDGALIRWVDLSARRKDIAELLRKTVGSLGGGTTAHSAHQNDELVARSLVIMDPDAPLSMKDVRVHVDGFGTMIAEGMRTGTQQYVQHVVEIIEQSLANIRADMHRKRDEELSAETNNAVWLIERMRMTLRTQGLGFGLERCVYDLCPDLPCQSPLVGDNHVGSLKDLLQTLDRLAPEKARNNTPIDRHVAAFIGSRLNMGREVWLSETNQVAKLAQQPGFVALKLFEQAQESVGRSNFPALTAWVGIALLEAIESFHSKTLRDQLESGLRQLATSGNFRALHEFMNQKVFIEADVSGFRQALIRYRAARMEIIVLRDKRLARRLAAKTGYGVAKNIAFAALGMVIMLIFFVH